MVIGLQSAALISLPDDLLLYEVKPTILGNEITKSDAGQVIFWEEFHKPLGGIDC